LKPTLVVSALNIYFGGSLTVLKDLLSEAGAQLAGSWTIIALVSDRKVLDVPGVKIVQLDHRRGWLSRLYIEFFLFRKISQRLTPTVWLSMRDISPRVKAVRQVVYCHNPLPFFRMSLRHGWYDPKALLHSLFYSCLYRLNIHSNEYVIVQQEWLRREFRRLYRLKNVVVAFPAVKPMPRKHDPQTKRSFTFLYPAAPRVWKNIEVLCEAARLMEREGDHFKIRITVDAQDCRYTAALQRRYQHQPGLAFIGKQNPDSLAEEYRQCDVVLFPSLLETWGLPISEAKLLGKPIIAADLPYAHETAGNYDQAIFLPPHDAKLWAETLRDCVLGRAKFGATRRPPPCPPFVQDWKELVQLITRFDDSARKKCVF
jgi:glycosyltransferase involved in cell wall biosynthesis